MTYGERFIKIDRKEKNNLKNSLERVFERDVKIKEGNIKGSVRSKSMAMILNNK